MQIIVLSLQHPAQHLLFSWSIKETLKRPGIIGLKPHLNNRDLMYVICKSQFNNLIKNQVLQWSPLEVHCILQGCNIQSFNDKNTGAMHPRLRKLLELTENLQTNKKKTRDFSYHSQSTTIIGSVKHITPTKQFSSSSGKSKVKKKSSHQSFKNEILSPSISHLSPSPSLNSSHNPSRETTPLEKAEDMEVEEYILPVGGCKLCQHLPPKERCCWYIEVEERSTTELEGSVLTCTEDETDRLAPLVN